MPDNGFGSQGNSGDFLLRVYLFNPHWKTSGAVGTGQLGVDKYITLHDPEGKIPFPIHNEATSDRLLTGDDFDVESIQRAYDGTLWFGEEFGPYLLHTDANGRVLDAPIPSPTTTTSRTPTAASRERRTTWRRSSSTCRASASRRARSRLSAE